MDKNETYKIIKPIFEERDRILKQKIMDTLQFDEDFIFWLKQHYWLYMSSSPLKLIEKQLDKDKDSFGVMYEQTYIPSIEKKNLDMIDKLKYYFKDFVGWKK